MNKFQMDKTYTVAEIEAATGCKPSLLAETENAVEYIVIDTTDDYAIYRFSGEPDRLQLETITLSREEWEALQKPIRLQCGCQVELRNDGTLLWRYCPDHSTLDITGLKDRTTVVYPLAEDEGEYDWLCNCGRFNESPFHCPDCGAQPPWGCDCSGCIDREIAAHADELDFGFFSDDPYGGEEEPGFVEYYEDEPAPDMDPADYLDEG